MEKGFLQKAQEEQKGKSNKKKIKNKLYRDFLDNGLIRIISWNDLHMVLDRIPRPNKAEKRACLILLYYSGCRPNEALRMSAKHIFKENNYICCRIPASKNGLPRTIHLPLHKPGITELYNFACSIMPERLLFWSLVSRYKRRYLSKRGKAIERVEYSDKLRYHVRRWFEILPDGSITTYYLRHNRFSMLAEKGARLTQLRLWKGCKTENSIIPYIHMSTDESKNLGRLL